MRRARIALALLVAATSACGTTANDSRSATQGLPDTLQRIAAHEWTLDHAASTTPPSTAQVTLTINSRHVVTGQAACNTYSGLMVIDDDTTRITHLFSSDAPCDAAAITAEREYFDALARIDRADTTDPDRLVLQGSDDTELVYVAQGPRAELVGDWRVVGIERSGELAPPTVRPASVSFRRNGTLVATSYCTEMTGSWRLDGADLAISDLGQASLPCESRGDEVELMMALKSASVASVTPTSRSRTCSRPPCRASRAAMRSS